MDPKLKWNDKYKNRMKSINVLKPNQRLQHISPYLKGGMALDLACGLGANSYFLSQHNFTVHSLDISDVAIDYVKEKTEKERFTIHPRVCDLSNWTELNLKKNYYDLVVITYYLDRTIYDKVKAIIKENGCFFMETYYTSPHPERQSISEQYKLKSNELLYEFRDWKTLFYEENEIEGRQTIFARK